jgi:hypothetical protein
MGDVVVTGRGIVTSIGETPDAFFSSQLWSASVPFCGCFRHFVA